MDDGVSGNEDAMDEAVGVGAGLDVLGIVEVVGAGGRLPSV